MAGDYDNELRGALFKNNDKQPGDTKADYTGSATVEGVDYFLDAWLNTSKGGDRYLSLKLKRKQKQAAPQRSAERPKDGAYRAGTTAPRHQPPPQDFGDDPDIPF